MGDKIMQTGDGRLVMISEDEARAVEREGMAGRILRLGSDVDVRNNNDASKKYTIESMGERFIRVKAKSGVVWSCKVGSEVTIEECAFVVRSKSRKYLLLEGIPPSPRVDERENRAQRIQRRGAMEL